MYKTKIQLARYAIEYYLNNRQIPPVNVDQVAKDLIKIIPCFVTIYVDKQLRGCVGNYETSEPLYINTIKNAINAAFFDNRFLPIRENDLTKLKITVSCLTSPQLYRPAHIAGLLLHLKKNKPGLLISSGFNRALFLPQVWEELPDPEDFLSHLCLKAGLPSDFWKTDNQLTYHQFQTF